MKRPIQCPSSSVFLGSGRSVSEIAQIVVSQRRQIGRLPLRELVPWQGVVV